VDDDFCIDKKANSMKFDDERGNSNFRFLDRYVGIPIIFALGLLKKRSNTFPDSIKKVAFLKTAGIGDTAILSGVVRDFKDAYPNVHLTFFVASNNYEMAQLISGLISALGQGSMLYCRVFPIRVLKSASKQKASSDITHMI